MKRRARYTLWAFGLLASLLLGILMDVGGGFTIINHSIFGRQEGVKFSFSSCEDKGYYQEQVLSREWRDDVLIVKGVALPGCSATWLFGSYVLDGNELRLSYHPVQSPWLTMCVCAKEVQYEILHLPKADYVIEISEGAPVQYMPFVARLFPGL